MFNSPAEGFPWDDLRKIFSECQRIAKVQNAVEILPKISTAWVGRTSVTDDRQTDGRQQIANVNAFAKNWTGQSAARSVCGRTASHARNGWPSRSRRERWMFLHRSTPVAVPAGMQPTGSIVSPRVRTGEPGKRPIHLAFAYRISTSRLCCRMTSHGATVTQCTPHTYIIGCIGQNSTRSTSRKFVVQQALQQNPQQIYTINRKLYSKLATNPQNPIQFVVQYFYKKYMTNRTSTVWPIRPLRQLLPTSILFLSCVVWPFYQDITMF